MAGRTVLTPQGQTDLPNVPDEFAPSDLSKWDAHFDERVVVDLPAPSSNNFKFMIANGAGASPAGVYVRNGNSWVLAQ